MHARDADIRSGSAQNGRPVETWGNSERPSLLLVGGGGAHRALRDASRLRGFFTTRALERYPSPGPSLRSGPPCPARGEGKSAYGTATVHVLPHPHRGRFEARHRAPHRGGPAARGDHGGRRPAAAAPA